MKFISFLTILFFAISVNAQIIIESEDMPVPDDTFSYRSIINLHGVNYTQTDTAFTWNFYTLPTGTAAQDTFVSVLSTPLTYNVAFSNPFDQEHKATVAIKQDMPNIYVITITDSYSFLKNSNTQFSMVGTGAKINDIALPMKYDNPDVWYHFPITYGTTDSSDSEFHANIPTLGYYGEQKHRVNKVDGWGTLILPTDTFNVIRVKSVVYYSDTIYLDTIGMGFRTSRTETEYKWLANGFPEPVLQITKRSQNNASAKYYYHIPADLSVNTTEKNRTLEIYPNPVSENLLINIPEISEDFILTVTDISGRTILQEKHQKGTPVINLNVDNIQKGLYFVRIKLSINYFTGKFIKI